MWHGPRVRKPSDLSLAPWTAMFGGIYALLAGLTAAAVWFFADRPVWHHPAVDGASGLKAAAQSAGFGIAAAVVVVIGTRWTTHRYAWAQALRDALAPAMKGLGFGQIVVLALSSGIAEELFFRGAIQPFAGLWLTSLFFGFVHQMPGEARWYWVVWTAVVGLLLGGIFEWTGHLLGPIVAHVLINGVNLRWLARHGMGTR